jgi:dienelactone hydrolase
MRTTILPPLLVLLLIGTAATTGEENPYERMRAGREEVLAWMNAEARRITDGAAAEMESRQTWEPQIERRRREMREMLGLEPGPRKTDLNARITGRVDRGEYTIEKVAFESLPKVYVTANLYLPKERSSKVPAVIYVCGHAYSEFGAKASYQRHPITLARHGYAAMILDPIQIAETFALHHGILNNELYDWYSRGYTPAGLEVWNVIRALDYLETRPEIDGEKFGITGRSGGAAMSWFSAAVDERLKVVVPVMGNSTYAANVEDNTQRRHCDCMFAINHRLHDMTHQGALIAPRPLFMAHGRQDPLFPVPGYEEFERVVGRLYESYDRADRFRNLVVESGHQDSELLRAEAVKWFDRHLMGIPQREIDVTVDELPHEELAVFGGIPPPDALNFRVHEFFVPAAKPEAPATRAAWTARRDDLLGKLRDEVFATFPKDAAAPALVEGAMPAPDGFAARSFRSEPGITIQTLLRRLEEAAGPALLYVASDGEDWAGIQDTLREVLGGSNSVMVAWPRGVGEVPWPKKFWKDVQRNAMHLGRTVDSMRLWDVIQASRALAAETGAEVVVAGDGVAGALGLYAGVLEERIAQSILINAPTSHRDAPLFLGILRHTDLPEAAALMAPRRVTFYGRLPEEFRVTREIFGLLGAYDRCRLSLSIHGALNDRFDHDFPARL